MRLGIRGRITMAFGITYIVFVAVAMLTGYLLLERNLQAQAPSRARIEAAIIEMAAERSVPRRGIEILIARLNATDLPVDERAIATGRTGDNTSVGVVALRTRLVPIWQEAFIRAQNAERGDTLASQFRISTIVGVLSVLAAIGAAWFVAQRLLRPVRQVTVAAREASADSLDRRIALDGPHDELREMADTFDEMLGRLQQSFDAQRRFTANAAHELRTPLAVIRAELDSSRTYPAAEPRELALADRVDAAATKSERLVEALLTLAHAEAGAGDLISIDLGVLVGDLVIDYVARFSEASLQLNLELIDHGDPEALLIAGDPVLLDRLVDNLLDNVIKHAVSGTTVSIEVAASATPQASVFLCVTNKCSRLDIDIIHDLSEPFRRGSGRIGDDGYGLGLSIVNTAAISHDATVSISQPARDSFEVKVIFPIRSQDEISP